MSIADGLRVLALETSITELRAAVVGLQATIADQNARLTDLETRQTRHTPGRPGIPLTQRCSSAPANDIAMADVVGALRAGHSIRGAAKMLGFDRNKVARLRQRAIAEGCLTVSPGETAQRLG